MRLDLTGRVPLPEVQRDSLNEIARSLRQPFTAFVEGLSERHGDNIDWWVTPLASRNVMASALFLQCCQLVLAQRTAQTVSDLREIVVETRALATVVASALTRQNPSIAVRARQSTFRYHARLFGGMIYRLAAAIFNAASQVLFSRAVPAQRTADFSAPVVLIDTFVYRESFTPEYRDRHYPGLTEWLTPDQRRRVYFLPTYYKVRNYRWLFRALRSSATNFLVKEDYLRASDYVHALLHPFRSLRFAIRSCQFEGVDIAPLVNHTLYQSFAGSGSIEGLLRYRLAKRLRDARLPIRAVIDWFENQEIDHGSNAGFRHYFPDTPITGYQGFILSPNYINIFATRQEMRLALIPHQVAVMGPAFVSAAREFCPDLRVTVAPAFRFSHLWTDMSPSAREDDAFTIFVALPITVHDSNDVLAVVRRVAALDESRNWRFVVKRHPATPAHQLALHAFDRDARFAIVDDVFHQVLARADVLISTASSVCIESISRGVPAIVIGSSGGLTFNPIPDSADPSMWALCYTCEELAAALGRYSARNPACVERQRVLGRALRDRLFTAPSAESVTAFLMLNGEDRPDAPQFAAAPAVTPENSRAC